MLTYNQSSKLTGLRQSVSALIISEWSVALWVLKQWRNAFVCVCVCVCVCICMCVCVCVRMHACASARFVHGYSQVLSILWMDVPYDHHGFLNK